MTGLRSPVTGHRGDGETNRDVGVVIVAGGGSTRTSGSELKQFRWVAGKPALLHSLQTFMARTDVVAVVVVLPRDYVADPPPWLFQCDVDRLMELIGPVDDRGIEHHDLVRLFNGRGACLAVAVVSDEVMPGVVHLATGAWFDWR